jgi:type VI secretion system protein VasJ
MDVSQLGTTPISDDAPAGKDVRYEPSFEALSEEIAKLGNPLASSEINWNHVVEMSAGILEKECKHLQVASYLCHGLTQTDGVEGLAKGVRVLRGVVENFWDTLYPPKKRMKGRRAILVWWAEKTAEFVENMESMAWEKEKRDAFLDDFLSLDAFLDENMEGAPFLRPMVKKLKNVLLEKEIKEEPPPAAPEPEASPPQADGPQATKPDTSPAPAAKTATAVPSPPAIAPDADAQAVIKQTMAFVGQSAGSLRRLNRFDPISYRLNRIAAWTPVQNLPPAEGGKTLIPPPDAQLKESIELLSTSGNWEALVDTCEPILGGYLFWMDLNRHVAEGMAQLGHNRISEIIGTETAQFVSSMAGIETLSFSDGTPFVDYETQEWLQQIARSGGQEDGSGTPGDSIQHKVGEKMAEAVSMVKEKKMDAALGVLMAPLAAAPSEREKFLWKLAVCRLLINAKQIKIAASYIDDILAAIEIFNLEKWEPDHAIEAFSMALAGLRLQKSEQHADKIQSIIGKISMLDPVTALKIV